MEVLFFSLNTRIQQSHGRDAEVVDIYNSRLTGRGRVGQ